MTTNHLAAFNYDIANALMWLRSDQFDLSRAVRIDWAAEEVASALSEANRLRDERRVALCFRVLNWLRAAREKEGR